MTVEERKAKMAERAARKAANQAKSAAWKGNLKAHREKDPMAWAKKPEDYSYNDPATLPGFVPPPAPAEPGNDYWANIVDRVAKPAEGGGGLLIMADQFDQLVRLSLERALDIMQIDLKDMPKDDKNFQKLLSTQQSIMSSVFSTAARIDDAKLRAAQTDQLDEVLQALKRHEQPRLPAPAAVDAVFEEGAPAQRSEEDVLRELMG